MCSNRESLKIIIANRYGPEFANNIRHLEFLRKKRARLNTSLIFLTKCRDWNLIPTCVRIKPRSDIARSGEILRSASVRLLKQLIRNCHYDLDRVNCELYRVHTECSVGLSRDDFDVCDRITYQQASRTFELCSTGHEKKLGKLMARREYRNDTYNTSDACLPATQMKTVVNLSNVTLDSAAQSILAKGMNFALTPKRIPYENVICSVVEAILRNKVPSIAAESIRQDVSRILRKAKLPKSNATTEERLALKKIRDNEDILVLKADKGNATVVINSVDYDEKIRSLLSDTKIYKPVSYNPTARVTRRIRAIIKDFKDLFTEDEFDNLHRPRVVQPPKLYGLPKVHKTNVPLRPIVSQIDSPTYQLAKYVASRLQPLVGNTSSFVRDSRHFVEIIGTLTLEPDDILVSFDIESLFTNVPVKECLEVIRELLKENHLPENLMVLLRNCLEGNFFLYRGQNYLQIDGVAMGSPVAPVMANIWMEHFEKSINMQSSAVKMWKRYVDDVFCIMKGDKEILGQFVDHLNSIHANIRFTYELEVERTLPFLDIKVMVRPDGSLAHSVYRKPTHTDRYLHATSHHHPRHLQSVARSLLDRAVALCDPEHVEAEVAHVQEVLRRNGYSVTKRGRAIRRGHRSKFDVERQPAFMPYVKGVTDKVGTLLKEYSIKTVYTPLSKLTRHVRTPKDVIPFQTPGVYKVDCSCGSSYIGQTKRTIAERIKEHIAAVKNHQIQKSAIAEHLLEAGPDHWIELHDPKVLSTERHYYARTVREAVEIRKHRNFNREDGFKLAASWNPVLSKCIVRGVGTKCLTDTVSVVCRSDNPAYLQNQVRVGDQSTLTSRRKNLRSAVSS